MKVKKYLNEVLQSVLKPIRDRREELAKDPQYIMSLLQEGTDRARSVAYDTLCEVKDAMGINYW